LLSGTYEEEGIKGHIAEAMTEGVFWPAGRMDHREVPDLFTVFQNYTVLCVEGEFAE